MTCIYEISKSFFCFHNCKWSHFIWVFMTQSYEASYWWLLLFLVSAGIMVYNQYSLQPYILVEVPPIVFYLLICISNITVGYPLRYYLINLFTVTSRRSTTCWMKYVPWYYLTGSKKVLQLSGVGRESFQIPA